MYIIIGCVGFTFHHLYCSTRSSFKVKNYFICQKTHKHSTYVPFYSLLNAINVPKHLNNNISLTIDNLHVFRCHRSLSNFNLLVLYTTQFNDKITLKNSKRRFHNFIGAKEWKFKISIT